ncbi:putative signal peptide protein [Vibrio variabilis]|uniref:Signal peptide protein n=1 Tax=Vibrio variabilis TaxID=990271 RepID=A0ABQ0JKR4_9VIBR|nr:putative signal peptide protein [Vibrio variabilis]
MKTTNLAITAAVTGLIALGGATLGAAPAHAADKEKCYGVSKAGKNDCATKTSSCAGTAKEDNQKDAFVVVPKAYAANWLVVAQSLRNRPAC